jgi:hypothetical protein
MSSPIVRCHPDAAHWVLVVLLALIGGPAAVITAFDPRLDPGSRWLGGALGAMLLLPTLTLAVWLVRAQVVADASGLRWRGLGRWRFASWPEVSDYYDRPMHSGSVRMIVETSHETLSWPVPDRSAACQSLRRVIEQNANSAPVSTWAILGTRPGEPRSLTFEYRAADLRTMSIILWTCVLGWMGMAGVEVSLSQFKGTVEMLAHLGGLLALLGGIAWLGFPLLLPAMALPAFLALRETQRRRHHQVRADAHWLVFEDGSRRLEAAWEEVMDYFVVPFPGVTAASRSVVVTRAGTFDFTPHLNDVMILKRMIAHYAKNAPFPEWRPRADETLGGEALRWNRGPQGDQERVYHYRTRTNRALLWLPTAMTLMVGLLPTLMRQAALEMAPGSEPPRLAMVLGAVSVWGWWRYFAASVRVSKRGIAQFTPFGRRFIPWTEVREYGHTGDGSTISVAGLRTRVRFWGGVADVEELKEEIARRSINSRNKGWETRK